MRSTRLFIIKLVFLASFISMVAEIIGSRTGIIFGGVYKYNSNKTHIKRCTLAALSTHVTCGEISSGAAKHVEALLWYRYSVHIITPRELRACVIPEMIMRARSRHTFEGSCQFSLPSLDSISLCFSYRRTF